MYFIGVFTPKKTMSILRNTFEGTRGKAIAGGLAAMMAVASLGGVAHAQDIASNNPNVTKVSTLPTSTSQGKPVIFRVGPGFNIGEANVMAAFVESKGCPTTVTTERGFPKRLTVEVGDYSSRFRQPGDAGAAALIECGGQS
tara:strand:- start:1661 stop:2086 length:426 start_codon:yes stop_codon:yes gene_type:complete